MRSNLICDINDMSDRSQAFLYKFNQPGFRKNLPVPCHDAGIRDDFIRWWYAG